MTPDQLLARLERMKAAVTTKPLVDAANSAVRTTSAQLRRGGVPAGFRVHNEGWRVTVAFSGDARAKTLFKRNIERQRPAIDRAFRDQIRGSL